MKERVSSRSPEDGTRGGSRQMGMARRCEGEAARVDDGSRFPVVLLFDPAAPSPSSTVACRNLVQLIDSRMFLCRSQAREHGRGDQGREAAAA
jgi:hypothetical protein